MELTYPNFVSLSHISDMQTKVERCIEHVPHLEKVQNASQTQNIPYIVQADEETELQQDKIIDVIADFTISRISLSSFFISVSICLLIYYFREPPEDFITIIFTFCLYFVPQSLFLKTLLTYLEFMNHSTFCLASTNKGKTKTYHSIVNWISQYLGIRILLVSGSFSMFPMFLISFGFIFVKPYMDLFYACFLFFCVPYGWVTAVKHKPGLHGPITDFFRDEAHVNIILDSDDDYFL